MKKGDCTTYVAKTKALISFTVTVQLICVFVFAYAKSRFSHDAAQFILVSILLFLLKVKSLYLFYLFKIEGYHVTRSGPG